MVKMMKNQAQKHNYHTSYMSLQKGTQSSSPPPLFLRKKGSHVPYKYIPTCFYPLITSKRPATTVLNVVCSRAMGHKLYGINYRPTALYKMNNINLKRQPWQHTACSTHMTLKAHHPTVPNFFKKKLQKRQKNCLIPEHIKKKK